MGGWGDLFDPPFPARFPEAVGNNWLSYRTPHVQRKHDTQATISSGLFFFYEKLRLAGIERSAVAISSVTRNPTSCHTEAGAPEGGAKATPRDKDGKLPQPL